MTGWRSTLLAALVALILPPLLAAAGYFLVYQWNGDATNPEWQEWGVLALAAATGLLAVSWLVRNQRLALRILVPLVYFWAMSYPVVITAFAVACTQGNCL
ncbi:MAG: hypothetical protein ACREO3_01275 [Arenimonas sp.]